MILFIGFSIFLLLFVLLLTFYLYYYCFIPLLVEFTCSLCVSLKAIKNKILLL